MTRVAILSDTHIPSRATRLPDWVATEIQDADHTIHAGDFDSPGALETILALADDDLTAVAGNVDARLDLPAVATVEIEDVTFVVTHGHGSSYDYEERVLETVREHANTLQTVGVSGHTHEVHDIEISGYRLLNPGSATAAGADAATMMIANVDGDSLSVVTHEG